MSRAATEPMAPTERPTIYHLAFDHEWRQFALFGMDEADAAFSHHAVHPECEWRHT